MRGITRYIARKSKSRDKSRNGYATESSSSGYTPVAARDYMASKGYGGAVDWDGEKVVMGGTAVEPMYVRDGTAYVDKSAADAAISAMENRAGIKGSYNIENLRNARYGDMERNALKSISEREEFSYDVESDPVFQAYKDQYERMGENALRRVLNDNNASVSTANGAVLSQAISAQNDELRKIAEMVPELYEDAYERYVDEGDELRKNLASISDVADAYYDRLYDADRDARDDLANAYKTENEIKQRWVDNLRNEENDRYDNEKKLADAENTRVRTEYYPYEVMTDMNKAAADITSKSVSAEKNAISNAMARGFFTESDMDAIPWLADYRRSDGSFSISPSLASIAYEYQTTHAREQAKINAKLGR